MPAVALALLSLAWPTRAASGAETPRLTILFFTASWCEPCRAVHPILERFARKNGKTVKLIAVDFDADRAEAERWEVREIPVVIAISDCGEPLLRADGASRQTLRSLESGLENLLKKPRRRSPP